MSVYLDHNATAPIRPEAAAAAAEALALGANPSSVHGPGRAARARLEAARETAARALGVRADDLVFTSGGAEAANLAVASAVAAGCRRLLVSAIEHAAVADAAAACAAHGAVQVETLAVGADGAADIGALEDRLSRWDFDADGRPFLALMAANNETGVIQPVEAAGRRVKAAGGLFLVDAVQAPGKTAFSPADACADYACFSAHKVGGPQGAGALALAAEAPVTAMVRGGGQEKGRRSGTENVAGAAGFAAALAAAGAAGEAETTHMKRVRDRIEARLSAAGARIWGADAPRLPNTLCLTAPGWPSEIQVIALDLAGFAVSAGAACSSGKVRRSKVLQAMGASDAEAETALRVSVGPATTMEEADAFAEAWIENYARVRPRAPAETAAAPA